MRAIAAFCTARAILEQRLTVKPEHARTIAVLAQVDAGLGQKELASARGTARDGFDANLERYLRWRIGAGRARPGLYLDDEQDRAIELLAKIRGDAELHQLRATKIASALESAARRSAVRENCRFARAEGRTEEVKIDNFFAELKRRNVYKAAVRKNARAWG